MSAATTTTQFEHLLLERRGPVARVTLNRPDRYNALSLALMGELRAALEALGEDAATQAIVLAGAGPGFSAGHDLAEMVGRTTTSTAGSSTSAPA